MFESGEQAAVKRAAGHQLIVGALGRDASVVERDDPIGQMQRGLAVHDQDRGPAGHDLAQSVVDRLFDGGIDSTGGIVKDEDAGISEDGPGQGDALALPAGEGQPTLADDRVVAARQGANELLSLHAACGGLDGGVGGVGLAIGHVGPNGLGEQEVVLETMPIWLRKSADRYHASRAHRSGPIPRSRS